MKLPSVESAVVELSKLTDYCLNPDHPTGKHKARVFRSVLGLIRADALTLRTAILEAARTLDAKQTLADGHGQRYVVDFVMTTKTGSGTVRSTWIVRSGESFPRLTSCFVL